MSGSPQPLHRPAQTGRDTVVQLRPFEITNATAPARWDPAGDRLTVGYDVHDPNHRIRRGRVRYAVRGADGAEIVVHTHRLTRDQLRHVRHHELPESDRWDGTINEGLPSRIGQRVTADLSTVTVRVEAWNTDFDEPAATIRRGRGRTEREGEWVSSTVTSVEIDAIVQGKWSRNWVIPYIGTDGDPFEPDKGQVGVQARVKNVAEGTVVRVSVFRIMQLSDPLTDELYVDSSWPEEDQPGLQGLSVQGDRVLRADGSEPFVRFNNHEEHWKHAGNNFYCFACAFGELGDAMLASERDYESHERDCLHMRFTVFIHGTDRESTTTAQINELDRFFRNDTKYFRSHLLRDREVNSAGDWFRRYGFRYIVIVTGHAACYCTHDAHPKYRTRHGERAYEMYHRSFFADLNHCPLEGDLPQTRTARREQREDQEHYRRIFGRIGGGCGNKSHVGHDLILGRFSSRALIRQIRGKKIYLGNVAGRVERDALSFFVKGEPAPAANATAEQRALQQGGLYRSTRGTPRFLFYADGCRTILTTNLGEHFTSNGADPHTKHYHGWIYSVLATEARRFSKKLFTQWIGGTRNDPATVEYDTDRFKRVYRELSNSSHVKAHPRLMEEAATLSTHMDPTETPRTIS